MLASLAMVGACAGELDDPGPFLAAVNGDTGTTPPDSEDAGAGDADPPPPTTCEIYQDPQAELVDTTCGSAGCHNAEDLAGNLDLVSPDPATRLVDVASTSNNCSGIPYINSSAVTQSLLFTISTGQGPCSLPMPLGMPAGLGEEDAQCLRAWMEILVEGAP